MEKKLFIRRWGVIGLLLSLCIWACQAQEGKNPFDVAGSKDSVSQSVVNGMQNPFDLIHRSEEGATNYNPFDVQKKPEENADRLEQMAPLRRNTPTKSIAQGNFNFILYTGILILFTFLYTLYRPLLKQIYRAFRNDNILKLLQRDQIGLVKAPYIIWYIFFFLSLSAFVFHIFGTFYPEENDNLWGNFGTIMLLVTGIFTAKHLILIVLGAIFPLRKELGIYSFTIILFSIILGLILLPVNLLTAFGPMSWHKAMIYIGLVLILLVYGYRSLRVVFLTSSKWGQHIFHFFIYLCTVEIAPIIVLFKLVMREQ